MPEFPKVSNLKRNTIDVNRSVIKEDISQAGRGSAIMSDALKGLSKDALDYQDKSDNLKLTKAKADALSAYDKNRDDADKDNGDYEGFMSRREEGVKKDLEGIYEGLGSGRLRSMLEADLQVTHDKNMNAYGDSGWSKEVGRKKIELNESLNNLKIHSDKLDDGVQTMTPAGLNLTASYRDMGFITPKEEGVINKQFKEDIFFYNIDSKGTAAEKIAGLNSELAINNLDANRRKAKIDSYAKEAHRDKINDNSVNMAQMNPELFGKELSKMPATDQLSVIRNVDAIKGMGVRQEAQKQQGITSRFLQEFVRTGEMDIVGADKAGASGQTLMILRREASKIVRTKDDDQFEMQIRSLIKEGRMADAGNLLSSQEAPHLLTTSTLRKYRSAVDGKLALPEFTPSEIARNAFPEAAKDVQDKIAFELKNWEATFEGERAPTTEEMQDQAARLGGKIKMPWYQLDKSPMFDYEDEEANTVIAKDYIDNKVKAFINDNELYDKELANYKANHKLFNRFLFEKQVIEAKKYKDINSNAEGSALYESIKSELMEKEGLKNPSRESVLKTIDLLGLQDKAITSEE